MKSIALIVTVLMLLAARAGAQPLQQPGAGPVILRLVPNPQEIALEHAAAVSGRSIFIAGAAFQVVAVGLFTPLAVFGVGGDRFSAAIAFGSVALIFGTTSLVLIPIGAAKWARHAKQERLLREGVLVF